MSASALFVPPGTLPIYNTAPKLKLPTLKLSEPKIEPIQKVKIADQFELDQFLSQSFDIEQINEDRFKYISSSQYKYLFVSKGRRKHKTITKYGLPFIKQYELPNTFISQTELSTYKQIKMEKKLEKSVPTQPPKTAILPLIPAPIPTAAFLTAPMPIPPTLPNSNPAPIPTAAPVPNYAVVPAPIPVISGLSDQLLQANSAQMYEMYYNDDDSYLIEADYWDESEQPVFEGEVDKIYYFQVCEQSMIDVEAKEYDSDDFYEDFDATEIFKVEGNKRNLLVVGALANDIGILLNDEVRNTLEMDVCDYRFPLRNKQIVIEIMNQRNKLTRNMRKIYNRIKRKNNLIVNVADSYDEKREDILLPNVCAVNEANSKNIFKKYHIRINDLVDPSFLACYYNITRSNDKIINVNSSNEEVIDLQDEKQKLFRSLLIQQRRQLKKRSSVCDKYWIASIFELQQNGNIAIVSDINNLSRNKYPTLYNMIAGIFKKMLPAFEWICGCNFRENKINTFRVIVKMMNYEIFPKTKQYKSAKHREGYDEENIIAGGIYYYYKSDFIQNDIFQISHQYKMDEYHKRNVFQDIRIKQNNFIVFNNRNEYVHHLKSLNNTSPKYIAQRKILVFFLVNPLSSKYKLQKIKTSKQIVVNLEDKLYLIALHWSKGCETKQKDAENAYRNRPRPRKKD